MRKKIDIRIPRETYKVLMKKAIAIEEGAKITEVVEKLMRGGTNSVYIVDRYGKLIGTILLRDLLRFLTTQLSLFFGNIIIDAESKKYMNAEKVEHIMRKPIYVFENEDILTALSRMEDYYLYEIPVVDVEERLLGELKGKDLLILIEGLENKRL